MTEEITPAVSVVIPCFNHGTFLPETVASLEAQAFRDYEVVIVDDGSTDLETIAYYDQLEKKGIKVIRCENRGVSAARNRGIAEARGNLILTLDADDYIGSEYLDKAVQIFDDNDSVGVVFCERQMFGERSGVEPLPQYNARQLLIENLIYPAAIFRKKDWAQIGGYNEAMLHGWEDWDFWIALSALGKDVVKLPEVMFFYRVRKSSRDHSLRVFQKLKMYWLMMVRNRKTYLANFCYVFTGLCRVHLIKKQ